jgi:hypothetical protein
MGNAMQRNVDLVFNAFVTARYVFPVNTEPSAACEEDLCFQSHNRNAYIR